MPRAFACRSQAEIPYLSGHPDFSGSSAADNSSKKRGFSPQKPQITPMLSVGIAKMQAGRLPMFLVGMEDHLIEFHSGVSMHISGLYAPSLKNDEISDCNRKIHIKFAN